VGFVYTIFMTNVVNKIQKVAIFIDGSNLYHKLKDLRIKNTTEFDYFGFCKSLVNDRDAICHKYYVGVVRADQDDKEAQLMRSGQQKVFQHLINQGFIIERGYLMKSGGKFHEKGVDVKIAVDMVIGAYENNYDVAILVSSDTDLIPAIKQVRRLGKIVEHIGFSHAPSFGLQKHADATRLFVYEDLKGFIKGGAEK
jgi:uncharacterized LabA/DUF88 family protein